MPIRAKRFYLHREEDESGISGTGNVAIGIELPTKRVVVEWLVHPFTIAMHSSISALEEVHGHGGKTKIIWIDNDEKGDVFDE